MIGILAAMDLEVEAIKAEMVVDRQEEFKGMNFIYGTLSGQDVVLCKCGVGKGLASMSTTLLCVKEDLDVLINVGVAGGLREDQKVMDIVISDKILQADYDTSPIDGDEGIGLRFESDPTWQKHMIDAAKQLNVPYHVGMISSQDIFMARDEDYKRLLKVFPESACAEMEGGPIAQIASQFHIPCVILRSLSDVVCHNDNPMEFSTYATLSSKQAATLIKKALELI